MVALGVEDLEPERERVRKGERVGNGEEDGGVRKNAEGLGEM